MDHRAARELVAAACAVLYDQGHEHLNLGHVSARLPDGSLVIKRSGIGLGEVTAEDVVRCSDRGELLPGQRHDAALHAETALHVGIYAHRRDVAAVVHTHPPYASAFAASSGKLRYLGQDSVLFLEGLGRFDDPGLVTTRESADRLAAALGARRAVLLRDHGVATVGGSVEEAVVLAVSLERALRIQALAGQFGELVEMSAEERRAVAATLAARPGRVADAWGYLVRHAAGRSARAR